MTRGSIHPSASVGPEIVLGEGAYVGPNCYVEGRTTLGARARLIGSVTLIGDVHIGDDCVVEPNVSVTTVLADPEQRAKTLVVGAGTRIGAGSVLSCGVTIGPNVQIGPGTIVVRNIPPHAIVQGNPATIVGYATPPALGRTELFRTTEDGTNTTVAESAVAGVRIFKFPRIRDLRGDLSVGEFGRTVPFIPKRYFVVFDVPSAETRGEHAHRRCEQFLVCVSGCVSVVVDDGRNRDEITLDTPDLGLYIPPRVWALQYKYSRSAVLMVFASHYYDSEDYIRDYARFLEECGQG